MEDPVDLDDYRDSAARDRAIIRRQRVHVFKGDRTTFGNHQQSFGQLFQGAPALVAPAQTWPEAAAKARYLIKLFAATPEAQDPRHQWFIANALDDLTRLCDPAKEKS